MKEILNNIILNPMLLLGLSYGFYITNIMNETQIKILLHSPKFYGTAFIVSICYVLIFRRIYVEGGAKINWKATIKKIFDRFIALVIAVILGCFLTNFWLNNVTEETRNEWKNTITMKNIFQQTEKAIENYNASQTPKK